MSYGKKSRCVRGLPYRSHSYGEPGHKDLETVFREFDKNNSNTIDGDELQQYLNKNGHELSPQIQGLLQRKYGAGFSFEHPISSAQCSCFLNLDVNLVSSKAKAGVSSAAVLPADDLSAGHSNWSGITFDRFVRACFVMEQLRDEFEKLDKNPSGKAIIDYDTFVTIALKLP